MPQKRKSYKIAAVLAYLLCFHFSKSHGDKRFWEEARKEFGRRAPENDVSDRYFPRFARKWVKTFEETGSVNESPRRKSKLSDAEVRAVGELLRTPRYLRVVIREKVYRAGGYRWVTKVIMRKQTYNSIKEFVALHKQETKNLHYKSVLRRLRQVRHGRRLVYKNVRPLKPLTQEQKRTRKKFCIRLYRKHGQVVEGGYGSAKDLLLHYLYRVCWLDAKTYYVCPTRCGWQPAMTRPTSTPG